METTEQWRKKTEKPGVSLEPHVTGKKMFNTDQNRVEVITRTEVIRSYNQGRMHLYRDMNVEKVIWYTALDELVYHVCGPLNGQEFDPSNLPPLLRHAERRCTISK